MRILLLLFFAGIYSTSMAIEDLRLQPIQYNIVKDEKDETIKKKRFILEGHVKMNSSADPIEKCLVGCTSSGRWVRTDEEGYFSIELKSSDSVIYFYLEGWNELVIEDYIFQEQHRVEMDVYLIKERDENQLIKRKPIIYLYSDKDISVDLEIDPLGEFIFTYPEYKDGWTVDIQNNELIVEEKKYPYLFWEGKTDDLSYFFKQTEIEGFIVKNEEVIDFLEDKLDLIGLNNQEKTDFITYWGPILQKDKFAFVQFVIDDKYDSEIGTLTIEPKPDKSKRIFMKCSNISDDNIGIRVIPQELKSFERSGFTMVEWGGGILDLNSLAH
jgi:hypothetical protein